MTRITRAMGVLLCLAASGVSTGALAQTITVLGTVGQLLRPNTVYKYTCGSPLSVSSPTNDGRTARVGFMNTDKSQVVIEASAPSQISLALRLIRCVCFKPENGYYNLSFSSVTSVTPNLGVSSAADFIRVNQNLCQP